MADLRSAALSAAMLAAVSVELATVTVTLAALGLAPCVSDQINAVTITK